MFKSCLLCNSGAQMEVDYTEKLNFSDDEENQAAKDKRENWWVFQPALSGSHYLASLLHDWRLTVVFISVQLV